MLRLLPPLLLLAGCGESGPPPAKPVEKTERQVAVRPPPPPAEPDVLANEAAPRGGQEAASVVESYYALIAAGKYGEAWKLRWPGRGDDAEAFAAAFEQYASYRANVGTPSEPQGAAGSLYVEVPVQIYGRLKNGESFSSAGSITLRRSNNVAGATAEQRQWRIYGGE